MKRLISTAAAVLLSAACLMAADYRMVVIPVEFSDVRFYGNAVHNKVAEAKRYLDYQFSPRYTFTIDLLPPVMLPGSQSSYGSNSTELRDLGIRDIIRLACEASFANFAAYDNDSDGTIDNICIITAGASEADGRGADCFWPQQGWLHERGGTLSIDGSTADCFTVCPELSSDGVFCHEIGHIFGLCDLYDTDGRLSGGNARGIWGSLSLMDGSGGLPNFSAIELEQLGLSIPITAKDGRNILRPISTSRDFMRIDTDTQGEYFLLECRDNEGWDSCLAGSGLVIYHVDRSISDTWYSDMYRRNLSASERWEYNQVNCRPEHPCARVIEAVPGTDDPARIFFPQPGHSAFGSETDPSFRYWNGNTSRTAICNISKEADGSVSFDIIVPITISDTEVFQDAAIIVWTVDGSLDLRECSVSLGGTSASHGTLSTMPDKDGICSVTLEGLNPQTDYQATVRAICKDGTVFSQSVSFRTKVQTRSTRPFIYLNSADGRNADGSFQAGARLPLRIYNAPDARRTDWFFNGSSISTGSDGFWYPSASGTLRAELWYPDGSCEIITKELTIR